MATSRPVSPPSVMPPPVNRGIPVWVFLVCWVVTLVISGGVFMMVLLMLAFSCDSSWKGCSELAVATMIVYLIFGILIATVPLVWAAASRRGTRQSRSIRVAALVTMLMSPILTCGICILFYIVGFNLAG